MSQSAKPDAHVIRHAPPMHVALALAPAVQPWLQRPQCVLDEVRSVSQPLAVFMSQSPKPVLHAATPHMPPAHEAVPLATVQTRPHMPQFAGLSAVRRHCPEQHDSPVAHACRSLQPGTQFCVIEQICPAGHWSSAMHPTHTCWVVSQWRETHCMSASQPASQRLAAVQYCVIVHASRLPVVHCTQRPVLMSHTRKPNSLAAQSVLSRHDPAGRSAVTSVIASVIASAASIGAGLSLETSAVSGCAPSPATSLGATVASATSPPGCASTVGPLTTLCPLHAAKNHTESASKTHRLEPLDIAHLQKKRDAEDSVAAGFASIER
jgi:hypothetical protein